MPINDEFAVKTDSPTKGLIFASPMTFTQGHNCVSNLTIVYL